MNLSSVPSWSKMHSAAMEKNWSDAQQHMLSAEQAMDFMGNRSTLQGDMHQVFLGLFDGLRDSDRDLGSLALADPHPAMTVTHDDQCTEVKPLAAFHHFRNAIDENDFVF